MITLGRTGLTVSRMGLGLAALGRPGYINLGHAADLNHTYDVAAMEAHAQSVLDAAWAAGLRYFDAARSYGRAEEFLGNWLKSRNISPTEVTIGSKWGYTYTADWQVDADVHEVKEHSLAVLQRQIKETRANLGDHLDLYQIHSATQASGVLENQAVLLALACLRDSGLKIGLSLSGEGQAATLAQALEIEFSGQPLFASVQATWNLLERSAEETLAAAHNAGMGVIIKEAVANGRLTPRNQRPEFAAKRTVLTEIAQELDTTIDALAMAAVLAQPWVDVVLSGVAATEHLTSNLKALDITWNAELEDRVSNLVETPEAYWGIRSELDWN